MATNTPSWLDWSEEAIQANNITRPYYVYTSGIKDIQVRYKTFEKSSAIVTNPITIDGNIISVALNTDQVANDDCSIEYYVSFVDNPIGDEWIPIYPNEDNIIINEMLFFNTTNLSSTLPLRFSVNPETLHVFKNKVEIFGSTYNKENNSLSLNTKINPTSIYTVNYSTTQDSKIIVPEKYKQTVPYSENGILGEEFTGGAGNHGEIFLSKTPYIDKTKLNIANYSPIKVNLYGEMVMTTSTNKMTYTKTSALTPILDYSESTTGVPRMKNMTDYINGTNIQLAQYDPTWDTTVTPNAMRYPYFEYLHNGRKVSFTETFNGFSNVANNNYLHGNGRLIVYYDYTKLTFRTKIILRNISSSTPSVTPVVNNYSLIFEAER